VTNDKAFTITKAYAAKMKASEAKMSGAKRRAVSKALVEANSAANSMGSHRQKKKA